MIKYRVNDTTAYGIYNGISEYDIQDIVIRIRKELNSEFISPKAIKEKLNEDKELYEIALENYKADPVDPQWREEIKKAHLKMAEKKEAPGYGYVPLEIVEMKIRQIIIEFDERCKKEEEKREERKRKILEEAQRTGKAQILYQWAEPCNDPKKECTTDIITVWLLPDGTTKEERIHTY